MEDELFDFSINVQVLAKNREQAFDYLSRELDIWRESAFGGPTNEPPPFVNDFQITFPHECAKDMPDEVECGLCGWTGPK